MAFLSPPVEYITDQISCLFPKQGSTRFPLGRGGFTLSTLTFAKKLLHLLWGADQQFISHLRLRGINRMVRQL